MHFDQTGSRRRTRTRTRTILKVLEFKLRQAGRIDFVRHDDVFAPLDVVIEKANVAAGWTIFFEMGSFNGCAASAADVDVAPAAGGTQNGNSRIDDHFSIGNAEAITTLRNFCHRVGATSAADVDVAPAAGGTQNGNSRIDDHFSIGNAEAITTLRNFCHRVGATEGRNLIDAWRIRKEPDIAGDDVILKRAPRINQVPALGGTN